MVGLKSDRNNFFLLFFFSFDCVCSFYLGCRCYEPAKVKDVDDLLEKYAGKEEALFKALTKKYGPEPSGDNGGDDDDDDDEDDDDEEEEEEKGKVKKSSSKKSSEKKPKAKKEPKAKSVPKGPLTFQERLEVFYK
jgi:hypothetical protein